MQVLLTSIFRIFYIPTILFIYLILLYPFKKSYKKRLVRAFELCGPVFIKCGQSISLKPYIFSKETVEACSNLQDKVSAPAVDLKKEMGAFYNDFQFQSLKPIASGSIACVFKAWLEQEEVAVKILRTNALALIKADLLILKTACTFLELIPVFKRAKLKAVVKNIEETLLLEIDFRNEQENLFIIKENSFKIYPKLKIPKVFTKYTTSTILVTSFVQGIPLSNPEEIKKQGISINQVCKNLIEVYLEQVYEDGFFHADFHPGNIFVSKDCTISLIDFGIVSQINYRDRVVIAKILNGFLMKDYERVLQAHIEGGYIKADVNHAEFKADLEKIGDVFIHGSEVKQFSISGILIELFRIMETYKIEIKEDLLLLYKTIFFVEAVVVKLNPHYNIWGVIKPWMHRWRIRHLGLKAQILKFFSKLFEVKIDL